MCSLLATARLWGLFVVTSADRFFGQATPHYSQDDASRERELTNFLQAHLSTYQGERGAAAPVREFLGKAVVPTPAPSPQPLLVPKLNDTIPQQFWNDASKVLTQAAMSTPVPASRSINAQPKPPIPMPWEEVMDESAQPLDTRFGSAIMFGLSEKQPATPPPNQDATDMEFVAQCPMVLFNKDLNIRAPSCNNSYGRWVDPSPLNVRNVLSWSRLPASGLRFAVDSVISGQGSANFAEITQQLTLSSYKFVMKNCVGIDRFHLEELVYKVDSMGHVSSTSELHDVNMNSIAYFFRYIIKKPDGTPVAESTLYRMDTKQVNFTEYKDGRNTGKLIASATKQGQWQGKGWQECMSSTSPRGWNLHFPEDTNKSVSAASHATMATVQDIRVACAGAITLMGHRDETRGKNGINAEGSDQQLALLFGGITLSVLLCILVVNCCMVFKGSGLKDKLKKTLFDAQGSVMPNRPSQQRAPALNPTY